MRALLSYLTFVGCCLALGSCSIWDEDAGEFDVPQFVSGVRPVYYDGGDPEGIFSGPPREQENNTGLVLLGDLLFVVDLGTGVHVYDNADPRRPRGLVFITVPGIATLTAGEGRLYANNFGDLVTIDIDDLSDVRVVDRDAGLFAQPLDFPENYFGAFECYDPERGPLVRWEPADLIRPECRR